MIILSNICIIALSIIFLSIISVRDKLFSVKISKMNQNIAANLVIVLFILLLAISLPRLFIWLF